MNFEVQMIILVFGSLVLAFFSGLPSKSKFIESALAFAAVVLAALALSADTSEEFLRLTCGSFFCLALNTELSTQKWLGSVLGGLPLLPVGIAFCAALLGSSPWVDGVNVGHCGAVCFLALAVRHAFVLFRPGSGTLPTSSAFSFGPFLYSLLATKYFFVFLPSGFDVANKLMWQNIILATAGFLAVLTIFCIDSGRRKLLFAMFGSLFCLWVCLVSHNFPQVLIVIWGLALSIEFSALTRNHTIYLREAVFSFPGTIGFSALFLTLKRIYPEFVWESFLWVVFLALFWLGIKSEQVEASPTGNKASSLDRFRNGAIHVIILGGACLVFLDANVDSLWELLK